MGDIDRPAPSGAIVWLGPEKGESKHAIQLLKQLSSNVEIVELDRFVPLHILSTNRTWLTKANRSHIRSENLLPYLLGGYQQALVYRSLDPPRNFLGFLQRLGSGW
jgi:hypothetical protein